MNSNSKLTGDDRAKEAAISNFEEFRQYIRENSIGDRALSARGIAGLCEVHHSVIFKGGGFYSTKLAQKLADIGFEGGGLLKHGFNADSSWAVVEYYAYESQAKASGAKRLARLFGALGVAKAFEIAEESKVEEVSRKSLNDLSTVKLRSLHVYKEAEAENFKPDPKVLEGIDPAFWSVPLEVARYTYSRRLLEELEWMQPTQDLHFEVFGNRETLVKDMRREFDRLQDQRRYVAAFEAWGITKELEKFEAAINGSLVA